MSFQTQRVERSVFVVEVEVEQEVRDGVVVALTFGLAGFLGLFERARWGRSTRHSCLRRFGPAWFGWHVRRPEEFLRLRVRDRRRRTPSRILRRHRLGSIDFDRVEDGGVGGLGLGSRACRQRRRRLAEFRHSQCHRADGQLVAVLQGLLPETLLPLTNVPLELPRSRIVSLPPTSKSSQWRRLTCDDLMRIKQSSWRPMLVTPSASLRVVEALRPRTTWST